MSKLIKTTEVMERLQVSRHVALRLMKDGKIDYIKIGPKSYRAFETSVNKFIEDRVTR